MKKKKVKTLYKINRIKYSISLSIRSLIWGLKGVYIKLAKDIVKFKDKHGSAEPLFCLLTTLYLKEVLTRLYGINEDEAFEIGFDLAANLFSTMDKMFKCREDYIHNKLYYM